ncbi:MAG: hypothetical protein JGK12_31145 [Microcoleus sp. PH2017_01_SCD_O_A]|uniref:hypothetical protein n=1 Tax=unclassified Microcoleus TaxID=2642155 RepID=UPI001DF738F7|nr:MULTISPECIES: hypothetical protein [unclassified Microcoleus]MCC3422146.1 hypothetical protein [Microcoleus sp. PH2017_07_MST_O_A]MCC3428250.1 hypothetical protein [Microcoleus sp. PH2017_01_SCD_O_A]MCC3450940.1 hypothetical protein [Microcoleus sp. PH2017_09_SFU_O_A]MCC3631882.1 hypothetical protein [Microcoleus sp. PH2017_39_LGB_O_B]MCC3644048.1 hypothetical protein [Microcoleus sp. PH2017_33_LGB_O_A]
MGQNQQSPIALHLRNRVSSDNLVGKHKLSQKPDFLDARDTQKPGFFGKSREEA